MIVIMEEWATEKQIELVIAKLVQLNYAVHKSSGDHCTVLGAVGERTGDGAQVIALEGVKELVPVVSPYKLASRAFRPEGTQIKIGDVVIGGPEVVVMAGPCAVENPDQVENIAAAVARAGAKILRGGAFKPRTSPYSFQGLGEKGLRYLREAADRNGMLVISEVMEVSQIPLFLEYVDILQVGARNMQNFNLLRAVGKLSKPVLLKRGAAATLEETLLAAEYILAGGNYEVILCERGIKTFETSLRNTLDISAVPVLKSLSHLPVIVDPSHATGRRDRVLAMAQAAVAGGSDGLLIEVHHSPETALCDGAQSIRPEEFRLLMKRLRLIAKALDRCVTEPNATENLLLNAVGYRG